MTTPLVVDASAAASWLLASQTTTPALNLLAALDDYELLAPEIFRWEIGNLLVRQARRDSDFDLVSAFDQLDEYEILVAPPLDRQGMHLVARMAQVQRLSLFDTSYLLLALSVDAALASRDADLLRATAESGLPILDLREPT